MSTQPEALQIAGDMEQHGCCHVRKEAALELRRLHKVNAELHEVNTALLEALRTLELGANTVNGCYTRNAGNFSVALRDLNKYAAEARTAITKATGEES